MTGPISWIPSAAVMALGWALIHFLWQGAAIAALAAILMRCGRRPSVRYLIGVAALGLMIAAPFATFVLVDRGVAIPAGILGVASPALRMRGAIMALPLLIGSQVKFLAWLVEAWACGVALLSLRATGNFLILGRARSRQCSDLSSNMLALCQDVQQRLGIRRAIRYLECRWLSAPAGFGALRPVILLPVSALMGLSEDQLRAVIAHELAHIRRWDFSVNLFQVLAGTLLFYHPVVWWLNRRIRAEREICCDEVAVSAYGNPLAYARALTLLAERRNAPVMAMAINQGILMGRVRRLLHGERFEARSFFVGMAGCLLLLMASLAGGNVLLAKFPDAQRAVQSIASASVQRAAISSHTALTSIDQTQFKKELHLARSSIRRLPRLSIPPESLPSILVVPQFPISASSVQSSHSTASPIVTVADDHPNSQALETSGNPQEAARPISVNDEYPAPALVINASHSAFDWERPQASDYCDQFAQQTVVQGANRPFNVDDAARQRYAFFYWHCMQHNGQIEGGEGTPHAPAYQPAGTASTQSPVNIAGNWAISFSPFPAAHSCTFTQTANSFAGTCARSEGSGTAQGVVDGRQVRWSWIYLDDEKRQQELDFIGMVGADGSITGQSIQNRSSSLRGMIQPFTAIPGAPVTRVAIQQ